MLFISAYSSLMWLSQLVWNLAQMLPFSQSLVYSQQQWKQLQKLPISLKSKLNRSIMHHWSVILRRFSGVVMNSAEYIAKFFEGSITLCGYFEFSTSCQKKLSLVHAKKNNGIVLHVLLSFQPSPLYKQPPNKHPPLLNKWYTGLISFKRVA